MGAAEYDVKRDQESQSDQLDGAHVLVPEENEDQFQERNLEAEREEKKLPLPGETEMERQGRQIGGLRNELPQNVAQPFAGLERGVWFNGVPDPQQQEFALNFRGPGRPKKQRTS